MLHERREREALRGAGQEERRREEAAGSEDLALGDEPRMSAEMASSSDGERGEGGASVVQRPRRRRWRPRAEAAAVRAGAAPAQAMAVVMRVGARAPWIIPSIQTGRRCAGGFCKKNATSAADMRAPPVRYTVNTRLYAI